MSIQSEINRINSAKADILAALTEKGVDTSGAGLADIAGLIAAIEAGGGGSGGHRLDRVSTGSFTMAEEIGLNTGYTFEHDCGRVPTLLYIKASATPSTQTAVYQLVAFTMPHTVDGYRHKTMLCMLTNALNRTSSTYGYTSNWKGGSPLNDSMNWTKNSVSLHNESYNAKLVSGATYNWTLYAIEE